MAPAAHWLGRGQPSTRQGDALTPHHEVLITNDAGQRLRTLRITNLLLDR